MVNVLHTLHRAVNISVYAHFSFLLPISCLHYNRCIIVSNVNRLRKKAHFCLYTSEWHSTHPEFDIWLPPPCWSWSWSSRHHIYLYLYLSLSLGSFVANVAVAVAGNAVWDKYTSFSFCGRVSKISASRNI